MAFWFSLWSIFVTSYLGQVLVAAADVNLCGQSDFWNATEVPYSFNNNAWGNDSTGYQCMSIHDGGRSFSVKYKWTGEASLVKGYPYMKYNPSNLPVQLWNISKLQVTGNWQTYVSGKESASPEEQAQAFVDAGLYTNVAIDMFLSDNITESTMVGPPIEIMIWPWWVPTVLPLGHAESTPENDTVVIDGTSFSLYHGFNDKKQHVFSWLSHVNLTKTDADYSPLLEYIWKKGMLSGALWLGQLELGTEIKHALTEVHFEASNYTLKIVRDSDTKTTTTTSSPSPTPTPSSNATATSAAAARVTSLSPSPTRNPAAAGPVSAATLKWVTWPAMFIGFYMLG